MRTKHASEIRRGVEAARLDIRANRLGWPMIGSLFLWNAPRRSSLAYRAVLLREASRLIGSKGTP